MTSLTSLRNIGLRSAQWLISVGILTAEDLYRVGVIESYLRVRDAYPDQVTLNLLYALQGAALDLPWNELPPEMIDELQRQVGRD